MKKIIAAFVLVLALVGCGKNQSDLVDQTLNSTVVVFNQPPDPVNPAVQIPGSESGGGLGTGFIIGENLIVTNNHVIAGKGDKITVLGHDDMKIYEAEIIAADQKADIAVIRLKDWDDFKKHMNPKILSWGSSRDLRSGETVWSMGNPYGLAWTVAQGIISHKLRPLGKDGRFFIQTTTEIYPGNSGGPLLNEKGEVIAINSAIVGKEGYFGMSIPSDVARKVVSDLVKFKAVRYAKLGIALKSTEDQHSVQIAGIDVNSKSIDAGLLPNDIIHWVRTSYTNGWIKVNTPQDIIYEMELMSPGDMVDLRIERDGTERLIRFPAIESAP